MNPYSIKSINILKDFSVSTLFKFYSTKAPITRFFIWCGIIGYSLKIGLFIMDIGPFWFDHLFPIAKRLQSPFCHPFRLFFSFRNGADNFRITSYNVCYTKLLRTSWSASRFFCGDKLSCLKFYIIHAFFQARIFT